jgi:hypothetical protein
VGTPCTLNQEIVGQEAMARAEVSSGVAVCDQCGKGPDLRRAESVTPDFGVT